MYVDHGQDNFNFLRLEKYFITILMLIAEHHFIV